MASTVEVVLKENLKHLGSIGDVVRGIIDDKELQIQQLTSYIAGR